jgi:Tfp pilus assembly protein PilO
MNLEQLKRTMLVSTVAFLVIIAVLVFVAFREFRQWQTIQAEIAWAEGQLVQLEQRLQRLHLLREHEQEFLRELELTTAVLPNHITEHELITEIQRAALLTGGQVTEFRFEDLIQEKDYTESPCGLTLEGTFTGLMQLLDSLQRETKLFRIRDFSIQSTSGEGLIKADLEISSFYTD